MSSSRLCGTVAIRQRQKAAARWWAWRVASGWSAAMAPDVHRCTKCRGSWSWAGTGASSPAFLAAVTATVKPSGASTGGRISSATSAW